MTNPLLAAAAATLDRIAARYALIGGAALAVHGVSRSTFDIDLLATLPAVLDTETWADVSAVHGWQVMIRRGEPDDPLAGVVRLSAVGERDVDIIVGRHAWEAEALERSQPVMVDGLRLPVVSAPDLILLKLSAGGSQDRWDVEQLLDGPDRQRLVHEVESHLARLDSQARRTWTRILEG